MEPRQRLQRILHSGRFRYSTQELLIALVLLLISTPVVRKMEHGRVIEAFLMTFVLLSGVLAIGARRHTLAIGALLGVPAILGKWIQHFRPDCFHPAVFFASAALLVGFVVFHLLRFVARAPRVNGEVLAASVSAYLLIGLLWALAYTVVGAVDPAAFTVATALGGQMDPFNALYFSFITLSTVGYGDITPVSDLPRMLAVIEANTGLFYIGILVSRLVSLYSSSSHPQVESHGIPPSARDERERE